MPGVGPSALCCYFGFTQPFARRLATDWVRSKKKRRAEEADRKCRRVVFWLVFRILPFFVNPLLSRVCGFTKNGNLQKRAQNPTAPLFPVSLEGPTLSVLKITFKIFDALMVLFLFF